VTAAVTETVGDRMPAAWGTARLLAGTSRGRLDLARHRSVHGRPVWSEAAGLAAALDAVRLLGRGGAAFPVAGKLRATPVGSRTHVLVNGSEGEPASHKDRALMRLAPHLVVDGALAVARALETRRVTVVVQDRAAQSSLAAALSQLTIPEAEKVKATPAVDLQALAKAKADKAKAEREAKAKAEKEAKAKADAEEKKRIKANPSRIWVQIAAGRNVNALAFDMRRFRKSYADEMGDETGWYADWGATNRLLIGPYRKEEKAKEVAAAIKKAGGDAFVWLSDAGEEVKKIGSE